MKFQRKKQKRVYCSARNASSGSTAASSASGIGGLRTGSIDRLDEIADQIVLGDLLGFARQRHLVQSAISVKVIAGIKSQGVLQITYLFAR